MKGQKTFSQQNGRPAVFPTMLEMLGRLDRGLKVTPLLFLASLTAAANNLPKTTAVMEDRAVAPGLTPIELSGYFGLEDIDPATAEIVQFDTVFGAFNVLLAPADAPQTVDNFLNYVDAGRYDDTIIHRSVPGFVVQGGGFTASIPPGRVTEFGAIQLEYKLPNIRGSIAMARRSEPNSATSGFYFNTTDNTDVLGPSGSSAGYAVFGHVMGSGMAVVDQIASQSVYDTLQDPFRELPLRDYISGGIAEENLITIHSVRRATIHPSETGPSVLTYSATSSDPLVIGAMINGSTLWLSAPTGASGMAEITVKATDTNGNQATATFQATVSPEDVPPTSRLANISTRAIVRTGDDALIPGFSVEGTESETVLIRAVGPTLADFGVAGTLADPHIRLFRTEGTEQLTVGENDDWGSAANAAEISAAATAIGAFDLTEGSKDAALLVTLQPGAYTVVTSGADGGEGVSLVEVYAVENGTIPAARLVNTSTRAFVGTGDGVAIPGIAVSPEGPRTYLVRAVGPTLGDYGVAGVLNDPSMVVYRKEADGVTETEIARNDNWGDDANAAQVAAVTARVGAFDLGENSKDAAMLLHLEPGNYTVVASGANGGTGVALVEVYEVTLP